MRRRPALTRYPPVADAFPASRTLWEKAFEVGDTMNAPAIALVFFWDWRQPARSAW